MSEGFRTWLSGELDRRKWSQRELARQAGLSQSFVTKVLAGKTPPSVNFCHKVAQALGEPPEKLLRLAGILPTLGDSEDDPTLEEINEIARNLPRSQRKEVLRYLRFLFHNKKDD